MTGTIFRPGDPLEQRDPYSRGLLDESGAGWQVQVWRSRDLIAWETLGAVYALTDGVGFAEQRDAFEAAPRESWRRWAPELHWVNERWALVFTSPHPVRGADLALSAGAELRGPWHHPIGFAIGQRHDPFLFRDDDGVGWLVWGATQIAPLRPDWRGFASPPAPIGPGGGKPRLGHEGCMIRKIFGRYVLFGTGWSTGHNLCFAVVKRLTGLYGPRAAGRTFPRP
ncbi:MAG: family 43 glycosylhydrolase [Kiritimatiellae bacterium]|nr:family 43 glycosylhydrolase [Kiritimatiellia bacterium]